MIYEIASLDVCPATQGGAIFIVNSADGQLALVTSEFAPQGIIILSSYDESMLTDLMQSPKWKQPCISCEI